MGNKLTKREPVDPKFLRPNGLYPLENLKWDLKTMKKFVIDRKVAPFYPGRQDPADELDEECPICMLFYPGGLNRARCCKKPICTECYFSIRPPGSATSVDCPFCQQPQFITSFTGPLSVQERKKQEEEEAKVRDLEAKIRQEEVEQDRKREEERKRKKLEKEEETKVTVDKQKLDEDKQGDPNARQPQDDQEDPELAEAIRLSLLSTNGQ